MVSGEGGIRTRGRGFCPDNRLAGGPNQPLWHLPCEAEGEGFEPPVGFNTHSCFQDSRLSPLGHPSMTGGIPSQVERFYHRRGSGATVGHG